MLGTSRVSAENARRMTAQLQGARGPLEVYSGQFGGAGLTQIAAWRDPRGSATTTHGFHARAFL
jgi:hypothetical protein